MQTTRRDLHHLVESLPDDDIGTVVYADDGLCDSWASIIADGVVKGRPVTPADAWIAAPALMFGIPLMTHNANHFETITGLETISFSGS